MHVNNIEHDRQMTPWSSHCVSYFKVVRNLWLSTLCFQHRPSKAIHQHLLAEQPRPDSNSLPEMPSREPKTTHFETKERPFLGAEKDDTFLEPESISNPPSQCRCGFVHPITEYHIHLNEICEGCKSTIRRNILKCACCEISGTVREVNHSGSLCHFCRTDPVKDRLVERIKRAFWTFAEWYWGDSWGNWCQFLGIGFSEWCRVTSLPP
jgi:hypothetical protein